MVNYWKLSFEFTQVNILELSEFIQMSSIEEDLGMPNAAREDVRIRLHYLVSLRKKMRIFLFIGLVITVPTTAYLHYSSYDTSSGTSLSLQFTCFAVDDTCDVPSEIESSIVPSHSEIYLEIQFSDVPTNPLLTMTVVDLDNVFLGKIETTRIIKDLIEDETYYYKSDSEHSSVLSFSETLWNSNPGYPIDVTIIIRYDRLPYVDAYFNRYLFGGLLTLLIYFAPIKFVSYKIVLLERMLMGDNVAVMVDKRKFAKTQAWNMNNRNRKF